MNLFNAFKNIRAYIDDLLIISNGSFEDPGLKITRQGIISLPDKVQAIKVNCTN